MQRYFCKKYLLKHIKTAYFFSHQLKKLNAVNIPVRKETIHNNIALTKAKYNYNFNKLYAKDYTTCDSLGFHTFPTLILIKNNKIHYQGSLVLDDDINVPH